MLMFGNIKLMTTSEYIVCIHNVQLLLGLFVCNAVSHISPLALSRGHFAVTTTYI